MKLAFNRNRLADYWLPAILGFIGIVLCVFVYIFKLDTLVTGYSASEITTVANADSGKDLLGNPTFLPHKILTYAFVKLGFTSVLAMRSINVLIALICVMLFYYIILRWHSSRIALLGGIVFATSGWMLHSARFVTPNILYILSPLLLIATGIYMRKSRRVVLSLLIATTVISIAIYTPYMFCLVLPVLLWKGYSFIRSNHRPPWWSFICCFLMVVGLCSPLIYASIQDTNVVRGLLGISFQDTSVSYSTLLFEYVRGILVGFRFVSADLWLVGLAIMDIASVILFALGLLTYISRFRLQRTKLILLAITTGSILLVMTRNMQFLNFLIPFYYIVIAGGITQLLKEWFKVFPRNPIARIFGASLVSILIAVIVFYNINAYFIAWPLAPSTKQAFTRVRVL